MILLKLVFVAKAIYLVTFYCLLQWGLVCKYKRYGSLATTVYFGGVMVGGLLFGYLADKFGRKPVMLTTLYIPIIIGAGIAFAPSYIIFVVLRFFQGFFIQV